MTCRGNVRAKWPPMELAARKDPLRPPSESAQTGGHGKENHDLAKTVPFIIVFVGPDKTAHRILSILASPTGMITWGSPPSGLPDVCPPSCPDAI